MIHYIERKRDAKRRESSVQKTKTNKKTSVDEVELHETPEPEDHDLALDFQSIHDEDELQVEEQ